MSAHGYLDDYRRPNGQFGPAPARESDDVSLGQPGSALHQEMLDRGYRAEMVSTAADGSVTFSSNDTDGPLLRVSHTQHGDVPVYEGSIEFVDEDPETFEQVYDVQPLGPKSTSLEPILHNIEQAATQHGMSLR